MFELRLPWDTLDFIVAWCCIAGVMICLRLLYEERKRAAI